MVENITGYEQLSPDTSTALGLTAAKYMAAREIWVQTEVQDVRWRADGTNPTSSVGMLLKQLNGDILKLTTMKAFQNFRVIATTGSPKVNVTYFGMND